MNATISGQGDESAPPGLRLPAAAGVLAGLLVLAIALALIAGDEVEARGDRAVTRLSASMVPAPGLHLCWSEADGEPVAPRVPASSESAEGTAPSIPPVRSSITDGATEINSADTGDDPAPPTTARGPAVTVRTGLPVAVETVEGSVARRKAPARRAAASTPLGSDAWSPILDGPSGARRVADRHVDLENLLG